MRFFNIASLFSLFAAFAVAQNPGTIEKPTEGTVIAPGAVFDFKYNIRADYSISSYAYSVWVFTEMPASFAPSDVWSTGYFFGRFDEANYPGKSAWSIFMRGFVWLTWLVSAVPYAYNPAPPNLTMPNFANAQGGFGSGKPATNATFYFAVLEEWADGTVSDPVFVLKFT
jgi:hypothetical protein